MIYSIGYQGLRDSNTLKRIVDGLGATLVDVRSKPVSRKAGFGRRQIESLLGQSYEWRGDRLGGLDREPTAAGIAELAKAPRNLVLMCMEEAPGDCHRHHRIAIPLLRHGVDVRHIYLDQLILASELQAAIDEDRDYDSCDFPLLMTP